VKVPLHFNGAGLFIHTPTEPGPSTNQNYFTTTLIAPRAFISFLSSLNLFCLTQFPFRLSFFSRLLFVQSPQDPIMSSLFLKCLCLKLFLCSSSKLYQLLQPPPFFSCFLFSTTVPVLTLLDFQTPNDLGSSMTSEVPTPAERHPRELT